MGCGRRSGTFASRGSRVGPWLDKAPAETRQNLLLRMNSAGYDVVSLTLGFDLTSLPEMIHKIAKERVYFLAHPD